jgi:Uncharacterized protein conserved in bacteria (DUF2188)
MTSARKVYHVVPHGGRWSVKRAGARRAVRIFAGKTTAIAHAKTLATRSALGQVRVHRSDGEIQTEYTYGKDPRRTRG